jgi:hemolysin activation/secretion protein
MSKFFKHSLLIIPLALIITESYGNLKALASSKSNLFDIEDGDKVQGDFRGSQSFSVQHGLENSPNPEIRNWKEISGKFLVLGNQHNSNLSDVVEEELLLQSREIKTVENLSPVTQVEDSNGKNGGSNPDNSSTQEDSTSEEDSCKLPQSQEERKQMEISLSPSEGIPYKEIKVIGNTVFSEAEIKKIIKELYSSNESRSNESVLDDTSSEDTIKQEIIKAVNKLYVTNGYLFFQNVKEDANDSKFVNVDLPDGTIKITINQEEIVSIEKIELQGRERLNRSYICDRLLRARMSPFNINELEEQLKLLRVDPLFSYVDAKLRWGEKTITVEVKEALWVALTLGFDNYSPPSLGGERFGIANLQFRNITGLGDQISTSYYHTTSGGADVLDIAYRVPLNSMNGTLQFRASPNWQKITQAPFDQFGIAGDREYYEITYRQPLLRSTTKEFALSLGFTYQDGQTFLFDNIGFPFGIGPDEDGVSRTSVIKFGQDYISRDQYGSWSMRSQFNFGTGLFDATVNDSPIPDGLFFSWLGQAQRVQILNDDHLLIIQADLQLTPDGLLPTERFVIGGAQSVRGYRQNVRSGDNGFRFSIEDRITVVRNAGGAPTIQLAPFLDMGSAWNAGDNPNLLLSQRFLIGAGLGFLWDGVLGVEGLSLRLDYGVPFINLDDRGNNIQDDGLYFRINYRPFR